MQKRSLKIIAIPSALIAAALIVSYQKSGRDEAFSVPAEVATGSAVRSAESAVPVALSAEDWQEKIAAAAVNDLRGLIEAAMEIGDPEMRHLIVTSIIDKWILEDARDFTKYLDALQVYGADRSLAIIADSLQESLTKLTPEQAGSDEVLVLVQRLIAYLAENDPDKAREWASKWLLDDTRDAAFVAIARGMAKKDIAKSLALIDGIASPFYRGQALGIVGALWALRDSQAALEWALALPNAAERALTLNSVLAAVAKEDASSAASELLRQAEMITEQYRRERAAELASKGMTEADLANDPETYREMERNGLISPITSPDVELMADSGKVIGARLASQSITAALDWVDSFENGYLKLKNLSGVLETWALTDPAAAVNYVKQNYPHNNDLLTSIYGSWALADPVAAADGSRLLTDPAQRSIALDTVVKSWSAKGNVNEVASYLSRLPAGENTDPVKLTLTTAMSQTAPDQAWNIAQTITNPDLRFQALKSAFAILVTSNPDHAQQVLNQSSLSENHATRLGEMVKAVVGN